MSIKGFGRFLIGCFNIFYPCKVHNKENLPQGKAILVCNHFRAIDCGFVADVSYKDTYFLAKSELFKNKFIKVFVKGFGGVPVNRGSVDIKSIKNCINLLNENKKLVIFPEGTRNKTGSDELQEIKGGTAYIAVKSKAPIVPLFILKKSKFLRKTHIIVGKPFEFSEYYDVKTSSEDTVKMESVIREKMLESQAELKNIVYGKKKHKK